MSDGCRRSGFKEYSRERLYGYGKIDNRVCKYRNRRTASASIR